MYTRHNKITREQEISYIVPSTVDPLFWYQRDDYDQNIYVVT